jgi:nucleoside 2-deoxyribosyltransferase
MQAQKVFDYYESMVKLFDGAIVLTALTGTRTLRMEDYPRRPDRHEPVFGDHAIVQKDQWMVEQADLIFMNLTNAKMVSIGCIMELAWAHQLGKHTVVLFEKGSIHDHAFVVEATDAWFGDNMEMAVKYIKGFIEAYNRPPVKLANIDGS